MNGRAESCLLCEIAVHSFARKFFRAPAGLVGYLGKLGFLFGFELNCHDLRLGASV